MRNMEDLLKRRMAATQQASELSVGDKAYEMIMQQPKPNGDVRQGDLPICQLQSFQTADIGFKPYPPEKLEAFSQQLQEEGLMVRIIVRKISEDTYEILAGHNRVAAAKLIGWETIPAEIVDADDARAIVIATSTNLIQRQYFSIIEQGKAYKALLDAKNQQGYRSDKEVETSGGIRQKYSARALVAAFFEVSEYEVRKAIKLTKLIPKLCDMVEQEPKRLKLSCADLIADYDEDAQKIFYKICKEASPPLTIVEMKTISERCPSSSAKGETIYEIFEELRATRHAVTPPRKITFQRAKFEPYLKQFQNDEELEELFLQFLQSRAT